MITVETKRMASVGVSTQKKESKRRFQPIYNGESDPVSDTQDKLRSSLSIHVPKLFAANVLSTDVADAQKRVLIDHVINCSLKKIIAECSNIQETNVDHDDLIKLSNGSSKLIDLVINIIYRM